LLLSALASRTADVEVCALVDACDSFDPLTGNAAGIALEKLLWVRCQNIDQALRAMDLLIQAGGFGMVAVDLSDVPAKTVRQVPLNAWFRFRRAVEDTPTILLLLAQDSNAKTCASLVLRLDAQRVQWSQAAQTQLTSLKGLNTSSTNAFSSGARSFQTLCVDSKSLGGGSFSPRESGSKTRALAPEVKLLGGYEVCGELVCSRIQPESVASQGIFEAMTIWNSHKGVVATS
jgi:recA bacterial DNA recombination protein